MSNQFPNPRHAFRATLLIALDYRYSLGFFMRVVNYLINAGGLHFQSSTTPVLN